MSTPQQQEFLRYCAADMGQPSLLESGSCLHILDLGREGYELLEELRQFLYRTADEQTDCGIIARMIYDCIIRAVVRILNAPPAEAIDSITEFPRGVDFDGTIRLKDSMSRIVLFKIHEFDILSDICQRHALAIYLKIRSQLPVSLNTLFTFGIFGPDYVTIREIGVSHRTVK